MRVFREDKSPFSHPRIERLADLGEEAVPLPGAGGFGLRYGHRRVAIQYCLDMFIHESCLGLKLAAQERLKVGHFDILPFRKVPSIYESGPCNAVRQKGRIILRVPVSAVLANKLGQFCERHYGIRLEILSLHKGRKPFLLD